MDDADIYIGDSVMIAPNVVIATGSHPICPELREKVYEMVVVNYRPISINGYLEASYPSSTTVLVMCVMPTAMMRFNARIKSRVFKRSVAFAIAVFVVFLVISRLVSRVHWFTDIVGGALFGAGLVTAYFALAF